MPQMIETTGERFHLNTYVRAEVLVGVLIWNFSAAASDPRFHRL